MEGWVGFVNDTERVASPLVCRGLLVCSTKNEQ